MGERLLCHLPLCGLPHHHQSLEPLLGHPYPGLAEERLYPRAHPLPPPHQLGGPGQVPALPRSCGDGDEHSVHERVVDRRGHHLQRDRLRCPWGEGGFPHLRPPLPRAAQRGEDVEPRPRRLRQPLCPERPDLSHRLFDGRLPEPTVWGGELRPHQPEVRRLSLLRPLSLHQEGDRPQREGDLLLRPH